MLLLLPFLLLLLLLLPPLLSPYIYHDLWAFLLLLLSHHSRSHSRSLLELFELRAHHDPNHILIRYRDQHYSYGVMERWSNRMARALGSGMRLRDGDVVALMLPNGPQYVGLWLALGKLGCPIACVNPSVRGRALSAALEEAGAGNVIASEDLRPTLEALPPPRPHVTYLTPELLAAIGSASPEPLPPRMRRPPRGGDTAAFVYTSGSTGLPKAAVITQRKLLAAAGLARLCGLRQGDVLYTPLPLYHAAGLMVGVGGCIEVGASCVLRSRFSASQFWDDCRHYDVTAIQYIGELLRYLCHTPQRPNDRQHRVRLAIGNGLRADVWRTFLERFGPISIREFYGATEGNGGFINYTGKIGAVGRANPFIRFFAPFELIKYDVEKEEPVRDERGLCIPVGAGEPGLLVTQITSSAPFHGYAGDPKKTEQKILRDVLGYGDTFFNTGDLLLMDNQRFLYFRDRVGDTFRWKGENVATTEVEAALAMADFIQEVNVYGVEVPGCEGRCGMASMTLRPGHDLDGQRLYRMMEQMLPPYAAPRFLRLQASLDTTSTFKQRKHHLVSQGFDPNLIPDPLFFRNVPSQSYVPLTPELHRSILDMALPL